MDVGSRPWARRRSPVNMRSRDIWCNRARNQELYKLLAQIRKVPRGMWVTSMKSHFLRIQPQILTVTLRSGIIITITIHRLSPCRAMTCINLKITKTNKKRSPNMMIDTWCFLKTSKMNLYLSHMPSETLLSTLLTTFWRSSSRTYPWTWWSRQSIALERHSRNISRSGGPKFLERKTSKSSLNWLMVW